MGAHDDPARLLTEQQKACLRLVARGMSSKEIAQQLSVSPLTVDTYLKAAIARLGAGSRREAARILEQIELPQKLGSPTPALAVAGFAPEHLAPDQPGRRDLGEAHLIAPSDHMRFSSLLRLPPIGGKRHDLTTIEKMGLASKVALFSLMMVTAIIAVIKGASSLLSI